MNDDIDVLQIKIDKAMATLPEETKQAINAVDWKSVVLGMRQSRGYSFEQLGDLETETELLLCGLLKPENYTRELEARMRIPKVKANELVDEMNKLVFGKIREELIKISEQNKVSAARTQPAPIETTPKIVVSTLPPQIDQHETKILENAGIKISNPDLSKLELSPPLKPAESAIVADKLANSFQTPSTKTEHVLDNLTKPAPTSYPAKADPYRMSPDE
jgi:hypothetical protein